MVTGVADDDTLYANVDGHSIRIRLAQIDAAEKARTGPARIRVGVPPILELCRPDSAGGAGKGCRLGIVGRSPPNCAAGVEGQLAALKLHARKRPLAGTS